MVAAVNNFLTVQGVNNYPIVQSPIKTSKKFKNIFTHTPKPTGTVTIRADNNDTTVRTNWLYWYKVAVHEFGHCLGLPDERQMPAGRRRTSLNISRPSQSNEASGPIANPMHKDASGPNI
jgi:hypothetical protein